VDVFQTTPLLELKRTLLRAALAAVLCVVAVGIPRFGLFMSLVGGVGSSTLSFVIPAVLYGYYFRANSSLFHMAACVVIVLFGITAAGLTSYKTILVLLGNSTDTDGF